MLALSSSHFFLLFHFSRLRRRRMLDHKLHYIGDTNHAHGPDLIVHHKDAVKPVFVNCSRNQRILAKAAALLSPGSC